MLVLAIVAWCRPRLKVLCWPLTYLAASIALSTSLVSLLKSWTAMDCPWDLSRYGGTQAMIGLFESRHGIAASGCFPAGHASAGYAWVALYFLCAGAPSCMAVCRFVHRLGSRSHFRCCATTARRAFSLARPVVAGGVLGERTGAVLRDAAKPRRALGLMLPLGMQHEYLVAGTAQA